MMGSSGPISIASPASSAIPNWLHPMMQMPPMGSPHMHLTVTEAQPLGDGDSDNDGDDVVEPGFFTDDKGNLKVCEATQITQKESVYELTMKTYRISRFYKRILKGSTKILMGRGIEGGEGGGRRPRNKGGGKGGKG